MHAAVRPESTDTLPLATRERVATTIEREVRGYFAHWSAVPGVNFDSLVLVYRAQVRATAGRREFDFATMEFLAALHNGHTDFNDDSLWSREGAPLGFGLRYLEGAWVVSRSARDGLRVGDRVELIDGEPFERFFQRQRRFIGASSERAARGGLGGRPYLFPTRFSLGVSGGGTAIVDRAVPVPPAPSLPLGDTPHRWIVADSVAYLRVPAFQPGSYEQSALTALAELKSAPVLILDLRNNGGGSTPWKLRKALVGTRHADFGIERDNVAPGLLMRAVSPLVLATWRVPRYRGRMIVLANGGCGSACEDLLVALKGAPRVAVVGDTTFGSTGQPRFMNFGNGMRARVSARRATLPDGSRFEGVGIAPDVYVAVPIGATTDVQLERALAMARSGAR
ncbi:MAG: peptidase family protein [Gemmatimonadetes bacterium]|nr:peptidase family protein [Gemmatimonadota bacterium]